MNKSIKRDYRPNLLLICGSGRDTGKTLLACHIIKLFKARHPITAIKISMHRHEHSERMDLLEEGPGYKTWEEKTISHKDSGRLLEAGANVSLYIETTDEFLESAFTNATKFFYKDSMIVCESGGLVRFVKPAILVFVQEKGMYIPAEKAMLKSQADLVADLEMITNGKVTQRMSIEEGEWVCRKQIVL